MEIRQLEYLIAVVEEANFTRAAERLFVTQPGVSAQIRQLEAEFGQPLLDRSARKVRLSQVGEAVLPHLRRAIAALADAREAADALTGLIRGSVAIGMPNSYEGIDISGWLADFHRSHPNIEITLKEGNSDDLIHALHNGQLDIALLGLSGPSPRGLSTQIVESETLVAVVAHDHPLASRDGIELGDLQQFDIISPPRGSGTRAALDEACHAKAVDLRIAFEVSNFSMLARLTARGLGVAFLPASYVKMRAEELHALTISDSTSFARIELAWREAASTSPPAAELIRNASTCFASAISPDR